MKKNLLTIVFSALTLCASAQTYVETLSRGTVAIPAAKGNFVSWRLLSTDPKDITFDLLRDGKTIAKGLSTVTNYTDKKGKAGSVYTVVPSAGTAESAKAVAYKQPYMSIALDRPADGTSPDGRTYSYSPNDCAAGDLDADGDYEIVLKWDPSNSHDNAHNGYCGEVYIDAYELDYTNSKNVNNSGKPLWRINLGKNIRSGAHYTQFLVYDFDGDGKAEMICKTAPGSIDGTGKFVTEAATDLTIKTADNKANYVNENGRILSGPEYLTVFSGVDGHAIHTIYYNPNRAFGVGGLAEYATRAWGDGSPGNRGDRFLAGVAFLGGPKQNPSAVMCRGYYTRSNLWAVDFDGKKLSTRWLHISPSPRDWQVLNAAGEVVKSATGLKSSAFGQGAHSLAVGDVDGDGCDEILYGSAAIDHDGALMYSTGLGHGDAQHLGDLDPDRPGLEYYMVHESGQRGSDLHDAATGEILFHEGDSKDTGRGLAADIDANHRGVEFWCAASRRVHAIDGSVIAETEQWNPQNFRIFWDGDLQEELVGNGSMRLVPGSSQRGAQGVKPNAKAQGPRVQDYYIAKWNGKGCEPLLLNGKILSEYGYSSSCNGTKATPCLQADLFGDWREEIILFDASDKAHLNVFTTNTPSPYRVPTLMHDHTYRMGVAWQNDCYNQPPHLGYYLPDLFK